MTHAKGTPYGLRHTGTPFILLQLIWPVTSSEHNGKLETRVQGPSSREVVDHMHAHTQTRVHTHLNLCVCLGIHGCARA